MSIEDLDEILTAMFLICATVPERVLLTLPHMTKEDIDAAKEELWKRWIRS
jgi:phage terminase Nu1 subunit (DNA packaging protein)